LEGEDNQATDHIIIGDNQGFIKSKKLILSKKWIIKIELFSIYFLNSF
jgi:hypothetical protein